MTGFWRSLVVFSGVCFLVGVAWGAVAPQVIDTKYPTDDIVIASVVVEPPADADADATVAIQNAIDAVAEAGGGTIFLPEGRYLLKGHLLLRNAVTLRGEWQAPGDAGGVVGTVLMPVENHGNAEGDSAIVMQCGAGLRELSIWYPNQDPGNLVPYPWTIETTPEAGPDNYTVHNVTLVNPWLGFKTGPEANELHTLKNVYITPLKTGVFVDSCTDIGRIIDIDISPRWWIESGLPNAPGSDERAESLRGHMAAEVTGIDMGRSDWEFMYGLHIEGCNRGMTIREGERGTTNAVLFDSVMENCGVALELRELNGVGLAALGCRFNGIEQAVLATEAFKTVAQFNVCEFSSGGDSVLLNGKGTLTFQNCTFAEWTGAAVHANLGAVSLLGCAFEKASDHIVLGELVHRVRVLGNTFAGEPVIRNAAANADVMIAHRAMDFAVADASRPPEPPKPLPATRALIVVTEHGASPGAEDNTAAFRAALQAAKEKGGGTVYVPAGYYRFTGTFDVPGGVELRGCFDVPHHTQSGGSVLMPVGAKGEEEGTPFIQLAANAGMRGLTIWYPEQNLLDIQPYPWAVRSRGPGCWLINVTMGNTYQGVDFWTHPSDGHYIDYLGGAYLKRGLFVSKSASDGWVVDVQMNPHYGLRLPGDLPRPEGMNFDAIIDQQRGKLEAMVFGRCASEHIYRTFLYAAYDGIAFRDDNGGANARIVVHGTDTGSRCAVLSACGPKGLDFLLAQLVPLGKYEVGAIIAEESFAGQARFFTSQMWAGNCSGLIAGSGDVLIQQLNTISGGITCRGGEFRLENTVFQRGLEPHVLIEDGCQEAEIIGNVALTGEFQITNAMGDECYARANSVSQKPASFEVGNFSTGWEPNEPQSPVTAIVTEGGGRLDVSGASCAPSDAESHQGKYALAIAGNADGAEHSYIYFTLFEQPLRVYPDSQLRYWFKPADERSRSVCIDLFLDDGSTLRDSGAKTVDGVGMHPGSPKGVAGEWRHIVVPLGAQAGKTIRRIMAAYDSRGGRGAFEAYIDDLELRTAVIPELAEVSIEPRGGAYPSGTAVSFTVPAGFRVKYSLNGISPQDSAAHFEAPIVLGQAGLWEVRYVLEREDGAILPWVFGELYDVR